jgi:hypothetical protein
MATRWVAGQARNQGARIPMKTRCSLARWLSGKWDDHPYVQRPIRRRFFAARFRIPGGFRGLRRRVTGSRHPLSRQHGTGRLTPLTQASLTLQDRTVASASLRTRPLDHARGHHYQGPGHLPGPDSHRQAILNLWLGLRHVDLLLLIAPEQAGCTTRERQPGGPARSCVPRPPKRT